VNRTHWIVVSVVAAVAAVLPWVAGGKYAPLMADVGVYALIAVGLGLLMGYAGQISLGHAGFFAVGAYVSAILTTRWGVSPWPAMAAGAGVTAAVAFVVGIPTLRLKGHYLAMATLGFGEAVHVVLLADPGGLTGGSDGVGSIPALPLGVVDVQGLDLVAVDRLNGYVVWVIVLVAAALSLNLIRSRVGRALRSLHDSETAANTLGVNTARAKLQVFVLSAVFASVAGSLHAHFVGQVAPGSFDLMWSIKFLMAVVLGGMASIWGPMAGAVILGSLRDVLEEFGMAPDLDALLFGVVVLAMMLFAPRGLVPGLSALAGRLRRRRPGEVAS